MHAVQTAAAPPNHGNNCFAIIGCIRNSSVALVNMLAAYGAILAAVTNLDAGVVSVGVVIGGLAISGTLLHSFRSGLTVMLAYLH
jgi:hypothetical protein